MTVVWLSRLQFAATALFHFLFVPLTLGLGPLVVIMETIHLRTGDRDYLRLARFFGRLFIINFVIGTVTGLPLEFQFGTNWSAYARYVGDVFGSLLAIEATVAFFLESTFLAVWIFGWNKLTPRAHAAALGLVALASNLSALWILIANAWMQHPVGYTVRHGRAELSDFFAVVSQRPALIEVLHTVSGAYLLSGFFVMGVSAYHLVRKQNAILFTKSFRLGLGFALVFSLFEVAQGHLNGAEVARTQPIKLAAMESLWRTQTFAPQTLLLLPDEKHERNRMEFGRVPGALSLLAYHRASAEVKGLLDFPAEDRPPVLITFIAFRTMVGLGFLFPAVALAAFFLRRRLLRYPLFLWLLIFMVPLPYLALECGWVVAEVGRQPWIVYGLMRTRDAVSELPRFQVAASLLGFLVLYSGLGALDFFLLAKYARRGPEEETETAPAPEAP